MQISRHNQGAELEAVCKSSPLRWEICCDHLPSRGRGPKKVFQGAERSWTLKCGEIYVSYNVLYYILVFFLFHTCNNWHAKKNHTKAWTSDDHLHMCMIVAKEDRHWTVWVQKLGRRKRPSDDQVAELLDISPKNLWDIFSFLFFCVPRFLVVFEPEVQALCLPCWNPIHFAISLDVDLCPGATQWGVEIELYQFSQCKIIPVNGCHLFNVTY